MRAREEVRPQDDGSFRIYWKDDSGKTRSRAVAGAKVSGKAASRKLAGRPSVAATLDAYCTEHRVADEDRRATIVKHLKAFFGADAIESIDIDRADEYSDARRAGQIGGGAKRADKTGSDATIRRELVVLLSAANHALRRGRIVLLPVIDMPKVQMVGQDDEVAYYSREELARLFSAADAIGGELAHFVHLLYLTSARRGSLEGLRRSQVQWDHRRLLLQPEGKVATKKRQPIVPLLRAMEAPLRALWSATPNDRLFVRSDFYVPYRALCESVGLAEKSNPHVMRHTRASHLLMDGVSIFDVAKLLGDSPSTIERVYGHHSHEYLAGKLES